MRTAYVSAMWGNATSKNCCELDPLKYGWVLDENKYKPFWFVGDSMPMKVNDVLVNTDGVDEHENDDLDNTLDSSDSESE